MFKKIFYTFTILAMLFGMFGVMGKGGVTPARAAVGWNEVVAGATGAANDTSLPRYDGFVSPGIGEGVLGGGAAQCLIDDAATGATGWLGAGSVVGTDTYIRVHAVSLTAKFLAGGIFLQGDPTYTPVECATPALTIDFVATIPSGSRAYIVIGDPVGAGVGNSTYSVWINRTVNEGGGLIVDDPGGAAGAFAQVQNLATTDAQAVTVDSNDVAWFDVPEGNYNLGYACEAASGCDGGVHTYVARYSTVAVPGWISRDPHTDTVGSLTRANLRAADSAGVPLALNYRFRPTDAAFAWDFALDTFGPTADNFDVYVTPGPWAVEGYLFPAGAGIAYDLTSSQNFPVNTSTVVEFRAQLVGGINMSLARFCTYGPGNPTGAREGGILTITPPFGFDDHVGVDFLLGGLTNAQCGTPTGGTEVRTGRGFYFTSVQPYGITARIQETAFGEDWRYTMLANGSPLSLTPGISAFQYRTNFARRFPAPLAAFNFNSTNGTSTTGGPSWVTPFNSISLTRGNWFDPDGNMLTTSTVTGPDNTRLDCVAAANALHFGTPLAAVIDTGTARDVIMPCDTLTHGLEFPSVQLANDWAITPFVNQAVEIGRYEDLRFLQTQTWGVGVFLDNGVRAAGSQYLFSVSPTDTSMGGHWSWSWVMSLYELGLTNGIGGGAFGPDQTQTRAQMAAFLARIMTDFGALPTGTATAFTDVPAAYWASAGINHLHDYGITSGCGGGLYCPEGPVTRAEMAKFIELTFRAIKLATGWDFGIGGGIFDNWDENINVLSPGFTFIDVPADHWANLWIEEMFWDGLTMGCTRDNLNLYFCPEDDVTRGQMAKFMMTALLGQAADSQSFWPVLAPER